MADAPDLHKQGTLTPLDAAGFTAPANANLGLAPELHWIRLADCVVDRSYQREITSEGERNIRQIIAAFDWKHFTPLVVAPTLCGRYAIIDGRHRATAASALGCDMVPAMIIQADVATQAAAFKAINATTTRMSPLSTHRAALVAGEASARALTDVCARAGVTIAPYPKHAGKIAPGETLAVAMLYRCLRTFGAETLITALMCITETEHNVPGAIHARAIRSLCLVLDRHPHWREAGSALLDAAEKLALNDITVEGNAEAVAACLTQELAELLPRATALALTHAPKRVRR